MWRPSLAGGPPLHMPAELMRPSQLAGTGGGCTRGGYTPGTPSSRTRYRGVTEVPYLGPPVLGTWSGETSYLGPPVLGTQSRTLPSAPRVPNN